MKRRSLSKTCLCYLACYLPLPNRLRVAFHQLAGVHFEDPGKVFIGYGVFIDIIGHGCSVAIGEHCIIGTGAKIYTHFLDGSAIPHTFYGGSVNIGDRVFIGTNAVIAKPVTIGSGAVVAANSLVTKDVPSYSVVMGVPARVVASRAIQKGIDVRFKTNEEK